MISSTRDTRADVKWLCLNDGPVPDELAQFPGYLLSRLGHECSHRFRTSLEPLGITPRLFGVLSIVAARPGITQQGLHQHTAIDTSSMVALVDELEHLGLAERRVPKDDRRARAIYLSDQGRALTARVHAHTVTVQRELFSALSAEELRSLHELLRKLAASPASDSTPPP